ncbi:MAG: hypothetical protein DMF68_01515 [Acidobacteria bacterium]|nr:MAG: hypothetical protein DMF68_01515 [Acidobacteriota bacterium]
MTLNANESKVLEPLTPKEIRRILLDKDLKVAALAREWSKKLGKTIYPSDVWAVIARREDVVLQEIRELLAEALGVDVSQVGREPARAAHTEEEPEAIAIAS